MQSPIQHKAYLFSICLLSMVLVGCPQHVKIGDLTSNAGRYVNKKIAISGTPLTCFGWEVSHPASARRRPQNDGSEYGSDRRRNSDCDLRSGSVPQEYTSS